MEGFDWLIELDFMSFGDFLIHLWKSKNQGFNRYIYYDLGQVHFCHTILG